MTSTCLRIPHYVIHILWITHYMLSIFLWITHSDIHILIHIQNLIEYWGTADWPVSVSSWGLSCTVQTKPPKLLLYWAAAPANISAGAAQISAGPAGISAGAAEISAGAAEISGSLPGLN